MFLCLSFIFFICMLSVYVNTGCTTPHLKGHMSLSTFRKSSDYMLYTVCNHYKHATDLSTLNITAACIV